MHLRRSTSALTVGLSLLTAGACGSQSLRGSSSRPGAPAHSIGSLRFSPGTPFVRPERTAFVNANGTPRIEREEDYANFWNDVAPLLEEWARDPRLAINPAYAAALIAKESGFEPFATSWTPANGYPQLTHVADADMIEMVQDTPAWRWMLPELLSWPRHPLVHRADAEKTVTDSLLLTGALDGGNEYFFNPRQATRGAIFWLRLLSEIWTTDEFPGRYGSFARERLAAGGSLSEEQLFDLVTVSYNRGYTYVYELVDRHGPDWTRHVNEEAADHLERIKEYTRLFEGRETTTSSPAGSTGNFTLR